MHAFMTIAAEKSHLIKNERFFSFYFNMQKVLFLKKI